MKIDRERIKHIDATESTKYLGADISVQGVSKIASVGYFKAKLERLLRAP